MSATETGMAIYDWVPEAVVHGVPVAWLAGYPRVGAALVRTVLAHCFGHRTGTIYSEKNLGAEYSRALKALPEVMANNDMADLAYRQGLLTFKTHEPACPGGDVPTIVIVRDGRRTFESLRAFYRERNATEYTMTDLIRGDHYWGDWSAWVRSWAAYGPRDALWLRYEDVMADVPRAVDVIAERFHLTPIGYEIPPFERLHAAKPTIFRKAAVDGNGGMTAAEELLFWELHGGTMTMLGYRR